MFRDNLNPNYRDGIRRAREARLRAEREARAANIAVKVTRREAHARELKELRASFTTARIAALTAGTTSGASGVIRSSARLTTSNRSGAMG